MESAESRILKHLEAFRSWNEDADSESCTLVQYSGPEMTGSIDVPNDQIEHQIEGCISEGFEVFWNQKEKILFLCVIESWTKPIPWDKVFRKEDFIDIEALMREKGFE